MTDALRVVVANPLSDENLALLRRLEPRLDVVHDADAHRPGERRLDGAVRPPGRAAVRLRGLRRFGGRALRRARSVRTRARPHGRRQSGSALGAHDPGGRRAAGARGATRPRGAGPHPVHHLGRGARRAAVGVRRVRRARRREAAALAAGGAAPPRVGAAAGDADRVRPDRRDRRARLDRTGPRGQAGRSRLHASSACIAARSRCRASRGCTASTSSREVAALADALVLALPGTAADREDAQPRGARGGEAGHHDRQRRARHHGRRAGPDRRARRRPDRLRRARRDVLRAAGRRQPAVGPARTC